jgi:hypothetical protein
MINLRCRDQCGRALPGEEAAMQAGWTCLSIAGGWRCGPCGAELYAASRLVGAGEPGRDELPPDSRGALPRETASTILPPVVKA